MRPVRRPRIQFARVYDLDQWPGSFYAIIAEPKGTERFADQLMFDLRIQKSFNLYKTFQLQLFADIFNLFNDATYYAYRDYNLWSEFYGVPSEMARPRRVQGWGKAPVLSFVIGRSGDISAFGDRSLMREGAANKAFPCG